MKRGVSILTSAVRLLAAFSTSAFALHAQPAPELDHGFLQPPPSARPRTLWMWMNGNVTADGITRDLEAMRRAGLGGALIFNVGEYIPQGPVDYGGEAWLKLMTHAAREADRLGLQLAMHNCPGWSSSGGPWITPAMAMQQLVWSETKIAGPRRGAIDLPRPYTNLGFYRDIGVLAFPSLPGEERPFAELLSRITDDQGASVEKKLLTDRDFATSVTAGPDHPLVFAFTEPFEARAISISYSAGGSTLSFTLEAGDDGTNFHPVKRLTPASPRAIEIGSLADNFEPVRARYFRLTPARARAVGEVELYHSARIPGWNYKANFAYRSARQDGPPPEVAKEFAIDPAQVIDLTGKMDAQGRLQWNAPPGSWTILRLGHTASGRRNIAAPDAGVGLECDKLSRAATQFHFEHGLGGLLKALGPLAGKSFTGLEVDSYEVGMQNWTAGFETEFKTRNGYDLLRYLPAMTGRCVGDAEISERFLWDLRRTQAEMVADNYYGELRELCGRRGMKLYVEPYGAGPGPYDELQIAGRADVPMGEFWAHFPWDDTPSVRLAASAAHVHGRPIVAGESFTATEEQSRFLDYPYALKTTGDLAFSLGLNQMFFHRFAHQPHPTAAPGMTMGPWGFNFDRNNPWFEKSSPWLEYLARCQFLLQQGTFVADVLYFTGEGSPQMSKRLTPELPPGYNFDAVDAEVLLGKVRVDNGRIVLPGGASYRLLLLPDDLKSMTPELLRKLRDLVAEGATLVGPKPGFSPSLRGYPASDAEVRQIADKLWGTAANSGSRVFGRGRVLESLASDEGRSRLGPGDFAYAGHNDDAALIWLHRRMNDADVYFVANRQRRSEDALCGFRVSEKRPQFWRPETGKIEDVAVYDYDAGRDHVFVPIHLVPAESVFMVFRSAPSEPAVKTVMRNGAAVISVTGRDSHLPNASAGLTDNFTVAAWIKPDTDLYPLPRESVTGRVDQNGKSYVVPVPENSGRRPGREETPTNAMFLDGHAAMGIAAGRNGVIVIEASSNSAPAVLVSRTPISGWTHLAVVYRDGKPSLYLNGKLDREGLKSGRIVHPGAGAPPPRRLVNYFDGDMTAPEVFPESLSEEKISELAARGLPEPEAPPPIEVQLGANGKVEAQVWQPGKYSLDNGDSVNVTNVPGPGAIAGPWQVAFPPVSGAPAGIALTNLISLHRSVDPGVRYFSGTASYRTSFEAPPDATANGRRLWLDLGRVAVIAEVRLNGRDLGTLWKPPFRVDITGAAHAGTNELEVRVTNLLVNRLIGDEELPPENEYDPRTRAIARLPDWFKVGKPKPPGGRVTFATWHYYAKGDPLVESGLLGPVRLLTSITATFKP